LSGVSNSLLIVTLNPERGVVTDVTADFRGRWCHSAVVAFSALPAGNYNNGNYNNFGNNANFWSATENNDNNAYNRNLNYNNANVNRNNNNKNNGFSVRCLRDK
jgi:uncharacterized protein (TIGR02145 family)